MYQNLNSTKQSKRSWVTAVIALFCIHPLLFSQLIKNPLIPDIPVELESSAPASGQLEFPDQTAETVILESTIDPEEYVIGPGDVFAFNMVSADGIVNLTLEVSPTGDLLVPVIGLIAVDKLTLASAIRFIREQCLARYENASIHVTLKELRQFKVLVVGPVTLPGFIKVNPMTRISDIANEVCGENEEHEVSHRNIKLKRGGKCIPVDLIRFYMFGDKDFNPRVMQDDIIEFRLKNEEVGIFGGVEKFGNYEYVRGETLETLIHLAGGFTKNADSTNIEITRFVNDTDKTVIQIEDYVHDKSTVLEPEDHIIIRRKRDYKRKDLANVSGEVKYPGTYSIEAGITTIGDLIQRAGGFSKRADQGKINVNNKDITNVLDIELARINLIPHEDRSDAEKAYIKARSRIPNGRISSASIEFTRIVMSFPLQRDDTVDIPALQEYVEILGAVVHPGRYPLDRNRTWSSYIDQAGGMTKTATRQKYLIKHSTGQRIPLSPDIIIENGDVIFIAEKLEYNKWERFKEFMAIGGQLAAIIAVIQNALAN